MLLLLYTMWTFYGNLWANGDRPPIRRLTNFGTVTLSGCPVSLPSDLKARMVPLCYLQFFHPVGNLASFIKSIIISSIFPHSLISLVSLFPSLTFTRLFFNWVHYNLHRGVCLADFLHTAFTSPLSSFTQNYIHLTINTFFMLNKK